MDVKTKEYKFDAKDAAEKCIEWIREWFENNGPESPAIVGISGGKDSSVVAALCVRALGKDRVYGVLMPQNEQSDIDYAYKLCHHLDIKYTVINVGPTIRTLSTEIQSKMNGELSQQAIINMPPRIRMSTLYAVSQSLDGRVANTCNYSEDYIGYSTLYGDAAGDFSPLANFTVEEVKLIGLYLGLPKELIYKTPADGLCGKTDEDNLGFTYQMLDDYLRRGISPAPEIKTKIDTLHERNKFKLKPMASFTY